jgi:hypothetical protein
MRLSKYFLQTLSFALAASSSFAIHAEWQLLAKTADGAHYYDDQLEKGNSQITFWRMTDFSKPLTNLEGKEVLSEKTRTTLDCEAGKLANTQVTRYANANAQGDIMNHYETPLRFTRIANDGPDAILFKKICFSK